MWTLRCFNTSVHRCSSSWVELFRPPTEYLAVFTTAQNLVGIDAVVFIICKFQHFTSVASMWLLTPPKWEFGYLTPEWSLRRATPKGTSCAEYDILIGLVKIGSPVRTQCEPKNKVRKEKGVLRSQNMWASRTLVSEHLMINNVC